MCVSVTLYGQITMLPSYTLSTSRDIYTLIHSRKPNISIFESKLCMSQQTDTSSSSEALLSCLSVFRATPAHWIMSNITTGLPLTISLGGEGYGVDIVGVSVERYPGTVCGNPDEI